ncbi:MAG: hypothetical protein LCH32_11225 [Bacteroidetes bacterium]|nr:hypothetical protein [Bacteroidota bacterium]
MKSQIIYILLGLLFITNVIIAQSDCSFTNDTIFIVEQNKTLSGKSIKTNFKNNSEFKIIKVDDGKFYIQLSVTENLYFDKKDNLELESNGKSILFKNVLHQQLNKYTGLYVVEIWKNYIATLKDEGLTSITFNKAKTKFYKSDSKAVKQIANCFYNETNTK